MNILIVTQYTHLYIHLEIHLVRNLQFRLLKKEYFSYGNFLCTFKIQPFLVWFGLEHNGSFFNTRTN